MNNIMEYEYQKILANNNHEINRNNMLPKDRDSSKDRELPNEDKPVANANNNILDDLNNYENYTMEHGIRIEYTKSEILDKLFIKLHRLLQIDATECIMIKPPKLRRSYNIDNIDTVNNTQFNVITLEEKIAKFEENITTLEKSLNDEERLSLYEHRLNKLQDFIVYKNEKYLYNEN